MRALAISLIVVASLTLVPSAAQCPDCVEAQYWQVDPGFWNAASPDLQSFPERQLKTPLPGADLGIAFSGGGTRSATATVGQLRGLLHHDWLKQVKYVTAVSGGSWAAAPYVYYPGDLTALLGTYSPDLKTADTVAFREHANGSLAGQIAKSGLASSGVEEVPQFLPDAIRGREIARYRDIAIQARDAVRRVRGRGLPDPTRQNKTYAHMLGQIFLDPLVKDSNRKPYGWTLDSAIDVTRVSGLPQMELQQVPEGRPFLIAGGTIIWNRPGFSYPRLIPVEYTPLYTGVRQQFGNLGGTYVMPWAYDRANVVVSGDRLLVDKATVRTFTLADMIGSSGAAPQLFLILGQGVPAQARAALDRAAGAFPSFNPIAIRDGHAVTPGGEIAHGDGGFTDNLGIMPLLARQVRNIIAFVNSNSEYTKNAQLQSYFFSLGVQSGSGDKSMNAVFPPENYRKLLDGFDTITKQGGPAIVCQTTSVRANELYNIAAYDGLKICWVYNYPADIWKRDQLSDTMRGWLDKEKGRKDLRHFPYYETFEENRPSLIRLNELQVNLLADLSCWNVAGAEGAAILHNFFGASVLPAPKAR